MCVSLLVVSERGQHIASNCELCQMAFLSTTDCALSAQQSSLRDCGLELRVHETCSDNACIYDLRSSELCDLAVTEHLRTGSGVRSQSYALKV